MFDCETAKFYFVKCRCMASYDLNIKYHVTVTVEGQRICERRFM